MVLDNQEYSLVKYDFYDSCHLCSEPTPECMGFLHAGDFVRYLQGENMRPRKKCGKCTERLTLTGDLNPLESKIVNN